ncbi:DNA ligase 3 isoform X2 [Macrosteles quadrilineatus]|uniref:DNA ligase 3 isoform X2 n=1 Tax=Macrosteles quadrilineatus TaxID=74068 RepID=UPI0023E0E3E4|nr:DNA ligase 3 isoform X2 [Macrosteles quadrilineatus]
MEDDQQPEDEQKRFAADRAKLGRAGCKKCKQKIETGALRIAKIAPNPFGSGGGAMKMWHHANCMFEVFAKQRATTARIESGDDVEGWDNLSPEDQEEILQLVANLAGSVKVKKTPTKPKKATPAKATSTVTSVATTSAPTVTSSATLTDKNHKDNSFREFRRLCADIANASSYLTKTSIVKEFFDKGTEKDAFRGDILLWCRLLLPGAVKRVYNLQSKQIIKLFSRIFGTDQDEMLEDLEQGDVAETIRVFFEQSKLAIPAKKSLLTLPDVDVFLEKLSKLTKEEEQINHFKQIVDKCTPNDLKMIIRLVKHDLRINAGPKHILEGIHPDAYQAFQTTRDIGSVVTSVMPTRSHSGAPQATLKIGVKTLTPVLPMLAEACKSVEQAMKKCPNGMYAEIKYDGERVQVHKQGNEFKFFSRSLKPVLPHKVSHFKDYIPQAFPYGQDMILDSEILMIDVNTSKPLPFGTLGIHKKAEFKDANVCLFVFDCIYYNGESLMNKPLKERRKILEKNMNEIKNHIVFSEQKEIHNPKDLEAKMTEVFRLGLEGLVLKDLMSIYEPGKRHWLKVKKDYLMDGAMADSADLIVLGAWYGTGQKGGMMSVFLMGCYNPQTRKFCTVTKVHTGHDDKTLERLQTELDMVKISKDASKVPSWLNCTKTMVPDFVARDPKAQPVWEITGAEFTKHDVHTASGISVRFPRVTRIRSDKDWETATSLPELQELYKTSKDTSDFTLGGASGSTSNSSSPTSSPRKRAATDDSPRKKPEESPRKKRASEPERPSAVDVVPGKKMLKRVTVVDDENNDSSLDPPPKKKQRVLKNPLPDVFVGVRLHLPEDGIEKRDVLERYFIAYGGEIVPADEATHTIVDEGGNPPLSGVGVSEAWLWDSIKLQTLQVSSHYSRSL